jgi:hypothetical protein
MPGFPQCCIDNVKSVGGKLCSWDYCQKLQERLNHYCRQSGQRPCAPIPTEQSGEICYCCCSYSSLYNVPIETAEGEHAMAQDIAAGADPILAGSYRAVDGAMAWAPRIVDHSAGIAAGEDEAELEFDYMYYLAYRTEDGSEPARFILATVDHLFLRPSGKVTPIQHLAPGDALVGAHGGSSRVQFVVPARYKGAFHQLAFDGFANETLDGHLLSANGVVTADYSVQLAYSNGELDPALLDLPAAEGALRGPGVTGPDPEALEFLDDETRWPPGMTPLRGMDTAPASEVPAPPTNPISHP